MQVFSQLCLRMAFSAAEVPIRIDKASAAMVRLDTVWKSNKISFPTKFRLYKSLVVSILLYSHTEALGVPVGPPSHLYQLQKGTWMLLEVSDLRIQAFENKCLRRLLWTSYIKHKTNEYETNRFHALTGPQEPLLATVK